MDDLPTALRALAGYQKAHAAQGFVVRGSLLLTEEQRAYREAEVRAVVGELERLADEAERRLIAYDEIDLLLARFRDVGKAAPGELVSNVARAIILAVPKRIK